MLGPYADTLRASPDIHDRHESSLRMAWRWPLVLRTPNVVPNRSEPLDAPTPKPFLTETHEKQNNQNRMELALMLRADARFEW